jgi:uncharacterized protein YcnI
MPIAGWAERIADAQNEKTYKFGDVALARIPYGSEAQDWHAGRAPCHDCAVVKGQLHVPGCDVEQCPQCDGQAISCDCIADE